jgi:hypothetical protein
MEVANIFPLAAEEALGRHPSFFSRLKKKKYREFWAPFVIVLLLGPQDYQIFIRRYKYIDRCGREDCTPRINKANMMKWSPSEELLLIRR